MRKKEWQNLYSELIALNQEFEQNNALRQHTKELKQKRDIEIRQALLVQMAFAKITANESTYRLLTGDYENNEELLKNALLQISDEATFSSAINGYLEKLKQKL